MLLFVENIHLLRSTNQMYNSEFMSHRSIIRNKNCCKGHYWVAPRMLHDNKSTIKHKPRAHENTLIAAPSSRPCHRKTAPRSPRFLNCPCSRPNEETKWLRITE
jgi:hypothetical protein